MNKKWMPIVAGILDIISGALQLGGSLSAIGLIISRGWSIAGINPLSLIFTLPWIGTGVVAILGGIYIIQRKKWNLAFWGAFAAFIPLGVLVTFYSLMFNQPAWALILLLGIAAIVLTVLSKKEFK